MIKKLSVFIFFLLISLLYIHNLTRDIYAGDVGDLVTAAFVGGVAHPPGYPLFGLLGFVLSHIPFPLPIVSRVGLISVFSSVLALIFFYKYALSVTRSVFLGLLSTSILAFSYLFWLTAVLPEGLALNNFFAVVILYLLIKLDETRKFNYFFLLFFVTGLSLTNQLYILTLFPALVFIVLKNFRLITSKRNFLLICFALLLGLSVYLYIPIAASRNPVINWDNASNLKNFLHLVLRKDYGGITHTANVPIQIKAINVAGYLKTILAVFSYQVLFVAVLGMLQLFRSNRLLLVSLFVGFLSTGVITIAKAAAAISTPTVWGIVERYYTLSAVVFMFFVPYGFLLLKDYVRSKFAHPFLTHLLLSYFLIVPILMIRYNYPRTDLSKTHIGNDLAKNIFASLPRNSVLFVTGDNTTFNIWYVYYALKERQDLDIINPPGVGNNIYLDAEINEYYKKHPNAKLNDVIGDTFEVIRKKRRMFTTYQIQPMPKGTVLVPKGLVFEVIRDKEVPGKEQYLREVDTTWKKVSIKRRETLTLAEQNFIAPEMPFLYSMGLVRIADFVTDYYKDPKTTESYYRRALWIDDENPQAYSGLALSLYAGFHDCSGAIGNIKEALKIYPIWEKYYIQLYYFYSRCSVERKTIESLRRNFKERFGADIDKRMKVSEPPGT